MRLTHLVLTAAGIAAIAVAAFACDDQVSTDTTPKAAAAALAMASPAGDDVITTYRDYSKPADLKLSGTLNSVGSDTMVNLVTLWAEGFARYYPDVKVGVEGKGSSTAPPALIEGVSQIGPMSRTMKNEELDQFEKKFGYKPTSIRTCLDALAVFVHKDCPLESISLEEIDGVFSSTLKRGSTPIETWGQLGLTGDWANHRISLFGRNSASGTYGFFKEHALKKGDFKNSVKEQPGSSAVVQGVSEDPYSMGYSGIGYKTETVRALPLSEKKGGRAFEANLDNVVNDDYPLGRPLLIYVNRAPGKQLDPMLREFLTFALSKEGQEVVEKAGYLPLPPEVCVKELQIIR